MDATELLLAESELLALLEAPCDGYGLLPVESDATSVTSGSGSETPSACAKRRRVASSTATKRKPTYYVRKVRALRSALSCA